MLKTGPCRRSRSRRDQLGAALVAAQPRRGDEEVEQRRLAGGVVDEHVAAGAEARQRALGDDRGEHRGDGRVDGVAARASTDAPASAVSGWPAATAPPGVRGRAPAALT